MHHASSFGFGILFDIGILSLEFYVMKLSPRTSRIIWITISLIAVAGMIAFTLLPVIYYR